MGFRAGKWEAAAGLGGWCGARRLGPPGCRGCGALRSPASSPQWEARPEAGAWGSGSRCKRGRRALLSLNRRAPRPRAQRQTSAFFENEVLRRGLRVLPLCRGGLRAKRRSLAWESVPSVAPLLRGDGHRPAARHPGLRGPASPAWFQSTRPLPGPPFCVRGPCVSA